MSALKNQITKGQLKTRFRDKRIAVVGNSFTPRNIADKVDGSDVVIRFNLDVVRTKYGYSQYRPPVPAGMKTTAMAGFWNRMNIKRMLGLNPGTELLITLRPLSKRSNPNYKRAGLFEIQTPVYVVSKGEHKAAARACGAPVLCGMSMAYILATHNAAKNVTFYNFNFYVPALNGDVPDVENVYKKCLAGSKGNKLYGFPSHRVKHNLTRSYKWFKKLIKRVPNFIWDVTSKEVAEMDSFLL